MKLFFFLSALLLIFSVSGLKITTVFRNVNPTIQSRVESVLKRIIQDENGPLVYLSFGDTPMTLEMIKPEQIARLPSEGFLRRSARDRVIDGMRYHFVYSAIGQQLRDFYPNHPKTEFPLGTNYAMYSVLEFLGIGFFHPFHVIIPDVATIVANLKDIDPTEVNNPKFEARGTHLHTMHPIEMSDYLQGFGMNLSQSQSDWEKMNPKWDDFLEWMVANRQNRLEWYLLTSYSWREFGESQTRLDRLTYIIKRAQDFGIVVGMVTPFVFMQQHSFTLIREAGSLKFEFEQMHKRMTWLMKTNCDFLTVEMGFSEFTHGNATRMLQYLNEGTRFIYENYQRKGIYTKIHTTSNQLVDEYNDPWTGKPPINYNFLPHYADKRLGVFPHTVQLYSLDDPAPTYGNSNFSHILKFMMLEADKRETVFYPETNYWVQYDSNVPLFLPLYAERRLYDLRLITKEENIQKKKVKGQINFSSGFEFTYWINDMITARSAWDPLMSDTHDNALIKMLNIFTKSFGSAQQQITRILFIAIKDQKDLLIDGKIKGVKPRNIVDRSGIAYLQGWDVWADLPILLGIPIDTHPRRLFFDTVYRGQDKDPRYETEIRPLMEEMTEKFNDHARQLKALSVPAYSKALFDDIVDTADLLGMRAEFVLALFEYAWGFATRKPQSWLDEKKLTADRLLASAEIIMARRSKAFHIPAEDIAAWRKNPTAYSFTYLWTATTLHWWKRDYRKVIKQNTSPCLMNIINPADIALGEGIIHDTAKIIRKFFENTPLSYFTDCLATTDEEPKQK